MSLTETIITPKGRQESNWFSALWQHRHVLIHLVSKDIVVRYKNMVIGIAWVVLQPLVEVLAFTLVFRGVFEGKSVLPYPIFVFIGVMLWTFFATTLQRTAGCMVGYAPLMKRLYFPRIILPLSVIASRFVDFLVTFCAFIALLAYYNVSFSLNHLWTIPLILLLILAVLGMSLMFCILHVFYRDVGIVIPYALRISLFLTPVIYPMEILPQRFHWIISLNPLTGIISAFRDVISGKSLSMDPLLQNSIIVTVALLIFGMIIFHCTESKILDEL